MSKIIAANLGLKGKLRIDGAAKTPDTTAITVLQEDSSGNVLYAIGTTVPSDNEAGYAKGCIFIDTDVAAGTTGIYENVGSTTACNFDTFAASGNMSTATYDAAGIAEQLVGLTTAQTLTNKTLTSAVLNTGVSGTAVLDEDDMATDSNTQVATQQSIKAYVDSGTVTMTNKTLTSPVINVTSDAEGDVYYRNSGGAFTRLAAGTAGQALITAGAGAAPYWGAPSVATASGLAGTFTIEGGTYDPSTTVTAQTSSAAALTIPDLAGIAQEWMFTKVAQTALNKTFDDATCKFGDTADATKDLFFSLGGATTAKTMTIVSSHTDDRSLTLPDATDTLVGRATTDTLTNKTLTSPTINTPTLSGPKIATGGVITDAGGDEYLKFTEDSTPVTYIEITSGDTGVAPQIAGAGETNTDLHLHGSGTGNVFISDGTDTTKDLNFELSGATTAKTMTITSSQTDDRTLTLPDATDTLVGKATTDTFTNKTIDCDGSGNAISNVNGDELDSITGNNYGVPFIWKYTLSNQGSAVNVTTNAPFKFRVLDAWSVSTSADGGTWKLDDGTNDLCSAVTVAASDTDIDRAADMDDAYHEIASAGTLRIVPDVGGALDAEIYILCMRVD